MQNVSEQILQVTRSADWWSFGAILLLLYTGEGPSSLVPSGTILLLLYTGEGPSSLVPSGTILLLDPVYW